MRWTKDCSRRGGCGSSGHGRGSDGRRARSWREFTPMARRSRWRRPATSCSRRPSSTSGRTARHCWNAIPRTRRPSPQRWRQRRRPRPGRERRQSCTRARRPCRRCSWRARRWRGSNTSLRSKRGRTCARCSMPPDRAGSARCSMTRCSRSAAVPVVAVTRSAICRSSRTCPGRPCTTSPLQWSRAPTARRRPCASSRNAPARMAIASDTTAPTACTSTVSSWTPATTRGRPAREWCCAMPASTLRCSRLRVAGSCGAALPCHGRGWPW